MEPIKPVNEITQDTIKERTADGGFLLNDEAAVKLVVDDTNRCDAWMNLNQWASGWTQSAIIYQSPAQASAFEGTSTARANVPKYTVSNHISAIIPKIVGGMFYDDPPFLLRPRPGTKQDIIRAKEALLSFQLDDMEFEEEVEKGLMQMALFGTMIMKWGWLDRKDQEKVYKRNVAPQRVSTAAGLVPVHSDESDSFEVTYQEHIRQRPWIKFCDVRNVLVDPGCRVGDIRRAKYVIYRDYCSYRDLDRLRQEPGYDIPDEAQLKDFFFRDRTQPRPDNLAATFTQNMRGWLQTAWQRNDKTTELPTETDLEILERWDNDTVYVILRHKEDCFLIRSEENPFHKLPFFSANWRDIPDSFYGQGLGLLIGSEQLVEQGLTNLCLDLIAYGLQPTAVRKRGFNAPTQQIRWKQGGIIDVDDDVDKAFKFLQMPPVPAEAWTAIQSMQSSAQQTSGANEQTTLGASSAGIKTTGMRSGTGASLVGAANAARLDGPTERFTKQIFVPWLYEMDELNNDRLSAKMLREIISDQSADAVDVDHIDFRNAKLDFEVLAGAHLGAKKEMAQFLPFIVQLINNPTFESMIQQAGYKFDSIALFKSFCDASGWRYSQEFMVPMTAQEKQQAQANSPAAIQQQKGQQAQQQQGNQFQHEQQMQNAEQYGRASNEVVRVALEHALTNDELGTNPKTEDVY